MTVATAKPLQGPRFYASQRGSRIQVVLKKRRRWLGVSLNFAKNTASEIKESTLVRPRKRGLKARPTKISR